jgi:subtilisin
MAKIDEIEVIESLPEDFNIDWGVKRIKANEFWKHSKGEGVKVAVIDTGIDMKHQDLSHTIKDTINMHTRTKDVTDDYGHGTHVAGLIAGKRTGVAPEVDLYIAKVLDKNGFGSMGNIIDGITFAINHKVDILCMSLGVNRRLPLILEERLKKAYKQGITIVCATGNYNRKPPEYPAFYDFVIGVGGIDKKDNRAYFSNFGEQMDVVSPSIDLISTHVNNSYAKMSGTSMASPLVAGGLALLKSHYRNKSIELSPDDMMKLLSKLSNRKTKEYGYGIMDLTKLTD